MRLVYFVIFSVALGVLNAQTTVNPDISVIGELVGTWENGSSQLQGSSVELAFQGYVNPYARVDVFLHKHMPEEPIEVEEAVLSIERGLPFGLALRTGKLRPDFGKINGQHNHTFPQIALPTPVEQILSDEKWGASGLEGRWLLPLPWYSNLSVAYLQNGISAEGTPAPGPSMASRYSVFIDLSPVSHLETGVSYYQVLDKADENIKALDLKYKWRPDKYRALVWQTELFNRPASNHLANGSLIVQPKVTAGYSLLNYQFNKVWNLGAIVDYSSNLDEAVYHSEGAFVGYSPAEETTVVRLFLKQEHAGDDTNPQFMAQMLWSLGPHKAHQF